MGRMIDADKLKKDVLNLPDCYNGFSDTYDKACIIGVIDEQHTADVRENVRGDITYTHFSEELFGQSAICKICGCSWQIAENGDDNFCPNCGADMRGEKDGKI